MVIEGVGGDGDLDDEQAVVTLGMTRESPNGLAEHGDVRLGQGGRAELDRTVDQKGMFGSEVRV